MKRTTLREMLPKAHRELLPELFDRSLPEESLATCDNCAMVAPGVESGATPEGHFRPDVKCCSYHPNLPNFLVGAILSDDGAEMAEGQRRIRSRMATRIGVGPVWLSAPKKYTLLFMVSRATSFGRSLLLRCPYFDPQGNHCSIWRHRDAVCTTFFCKYVGGAEGERAWRAIEAVLRRSERALAEYASTQVGLGVAQLPSGLDSLSLEELEERAPDEAWYASIWRDWVGREEAYYKACYDIVRGLDRDVFSTIAATDEMTSAIRNAERAIDELR